MLNIFESKYKVCIVAKPFFSILELNHFLVFWKYLYNSNTDSFDFYICLSLLYSCLFFIFQFLLSFYYFVPIKLKESCFFSPRNGISIV